MGRVVGFLLAFVFCSSVFAVEPVTVTVKPKRVRKRVKKRRVVKKRKYRTPTGEKYDFEALSPLRLERGYRQVGWRLGLPMRISFKIRNNLNLTYPGRVVFRVYRNDKVIRIMSYEGMGPRETKETTITYTPRERGLGKYKVVVDPKNWIDESNEGNNEVEKGLFIDAPKHDVSSHGIHVSGRTPQDRLNSIKVNRTGTISFNLRNITNHELRNLRNVEFKLMIGDEYIFGGPIGPMGPRDTRLVFRQHKFTKVGTHTIKLFLDPKDALYETNEDNNVFSRRFRVTR